MSERTLHLVSPLQHGHDVELHQQDLNEVLKAWSVNHQVTVDGQYGPHTRKIDEKVCYGLGIAQEHIAHGITPQVRVWIRHPDQRPDQQKQTARARRQWRERLRKHYDGHGIDAAVKFAKAQIGVEEHPAGSNTGPKIDEWQAACGVHGTFWCGCFVNACLMAGGFEPQPWLRYCPSIEANARAGVNGWAWKPATARPKKGWLALFTENGIAGHVEFVVGAQKAGFPIDVGGNTSKQGESSSQSNGGCVAEHTDRRPSGGFPIRGYAVPPWHTKKKGG